MPAMRSLIWAAGRPVLGSSRVCSAPASSCLLTDARIFTCHQSVAASATRQLSTQQTPHTLLYAEKFKLYTKVSSVARAACNTAGGKGTAPTSWRAPCRRCP